jgi:hypothetical protein
VQHQRTLREKLSPYKYRKGKTVLGRTDWTLHAVIGFALCVEPNEYFAPRAKRILTRFFSFENL